jgi:hypothetical protein
MRQLLVVGLLAVVAACGSPSPTPSASSSPAVSATPVREFGVLGDVDAAGRTVSYLEAELFVDDEAEVEAAKDGRNVPNRFYVREGTTTRTLPVAPDAAVSVLGYDAEGNFSPVPLSVDEFLAHDPVIDVTPFYWLDVADGRIVGITAVESP